MKVELRPGDAQATLLQQKFEAALAQAVDAKDAAMFESSPPGVLVFYFTPAAARIFRADLIANAAADCVAPPRDGAWLLVGRADALDMLAPTLNRREA